MNDKLIKKLQPGPGLYIIRPIPIEKSNSQITISNIKEDAYKKGEIIAVGGIEYTKNGEAIAPFFKIGDIVRYAFAGHEEIHEEAEVAHLIPFRQCLVRYL